MSDFEEFEERVSGGEDEFTFPQCNGCKHYNGDGTCGAFPDSIPDDIFLNRHDHKKPYPGDNGITFEPK